MTSSTTSCSLPTMTRNQMPPLLFRLWDEERLTMSADKQAVISGHDNRKWPYAGKKLSEIPTSTLLKDMIYYGNSRLSKITENFGQAESMFYAFSKDLHSIIYLHSYEHRYKKPLLFLADGQDALANSGASFVRDTDALAKYPKEAFKYWQESEDLQEGRPESAGRFYRYVNNTVHTFIKEVDIFGKLPCKFYTIFDWDTLSEDLIREGFLERTAVENVEKHSTDIFQTAPAPQGQYNVGLFRHNIWQRACAESAAHPAAAAQSVGLMLFNIFSRHQVHRYPMAKFGDHYKELFTEFAAREIRNYRTFETLMMVKINGHELRRMGSANSVVDGQPGHTDVYLTNTNLEFHHSATATIVNSFEAKVYCPSGGIVKARLLIPGSDRKMHELDFVGKANVYLKPENHPAAFHLPPGKFTFTAFVNQATAAFTHELHVTVESMPQEAVIERTMAAKRN